ncbi:GNAT family N-acetyltransferase [Solwaraspora sp. WMMD406]|uniref:GNAT family N-acetyltransferase n=1 Tax=Solwaraspora sp. WMMD406 TaxID=3016095 RepID=UPI00241658A5|nr:GNAT family N-acetyltransferase [Solwaraspora sp. WMMD406]MDG4763057.1 GNAT family N-acetyltransferase [Solwaraspora sp. WMMD406]
MSRRLVNLTLDTLEDLPRTCRRCVFWELDPAAAERACADGDPALEKEAWVSQTLLEWGSCGKLAYVDGMPAGFVMYAPPAYLPRSMAFPTSPVSADAVLLTTGHVVAPFAGGGLGRMLVQAVARDLTKRGIKAIEAFGVANAPEGAEPGERGCLAPADFYLSVGFKTVRQHPRVPRLRLELRTALSWKSDVEYALEKLLGSMSPESLLRPATRVMTN